MPTVTETPHTLFAACTDPKCRGNKQRPIKGFRVETSWTFVERGGDLPGFENSSIAFRPENDGQDGRPNDGVCPVCEATADITDQVRPLYENLSGFPASESLKHFGSYKPDKERSAEVDAVLERLADVIAGG